jgi:cytochrome c oxidase subunit 2
MRITIPWTITLALMGAAIAAPAADLAAGKTAYAVCTACHGPNGEGVKALNAPRLAGQEIWYLIRQIKYYKTGIRGTHPQDVYGQQMAPMAHTLTDDAAIENVAAYINSLSAPPSAPTVQGDPAKGKALYVVCATCHGQHGEGNEALNAPRQAGMDDWYMARQLEHFRDGIRGTHAQDLYGQQMAPMAKTLPDAQAIADVVSYINTLR